MDFETTDSPTEEPAVTKDLATTGAGISYAALGSAMLMMGLGVFLLHRQVFDVI